MMPDATKWIIDTIALLAVVGVIVAFALWTSGTTKR
jgi:hypothetical protein